MFYRIEISNLIQLPTQITHLCLFTISSCLSRQYYFVNNRTTWTEAQAYCRQYYTDLATLENANDTSSLTAAVNSSYNNLAWIGLYDDVENIWIGLYRTRLWSDQSNSTYENWLTGQPDNLNYVEHCTAASLGNSGQWTDENCNQTLPFFCYRGEFNKLFL
uniref:C-type lectin domain-containing protein n=1 Tax=Pygocentrus nattereri TaxID=42514 RepID=A0AAR2L4I4_PYGNA